MVKLVGFAVSNYYNKVLLAMLEKDISHQEELNWADKEESTLARSPLGKVPFLDTDAGSICESQVIMEYLEDAYPEHPLLPKDPYERAKVRELVTFLEVHMELVARRLYPEAFFGGKVSDETKEEVRKDLRRSIAGFARLAKFSPYVAGDAFSMADCAAIIHLPLVSMATKATYGEDFLAGLPVKDYLKQMGERASVQKMAAGRKANQELMAKQRKG